MAFSLRRMLSNITYFSKPGDGENPHKEVSDVLSIEKQHKDRIPSFQPLDIIEFDHVETDPTRNGTNSLILPDSVKSFAAKKVSLSDTNLLNINDATSKDIEKCTKLKLDINKASQSLNESIDYSEDSSLNVENTPKHKHLESKSLDLFKGFNFNQSFDLSDTVYIETSSDEDEFDIESLTEQSDTDISGETNEGDKTDIKMCRKVEPTVNIEDFIMASPESFADVEVDKNEEERITLLFNYQMKLEKLECFLKKLLTEFQFHIEVSKIFKCKSIVTTLPGSDVSNIPKSLGDVTYIDNIPHGVSPVAWNVILEKEDNEAKLKLKNQLQTMQLAIDEFVNRYLVKKPKLKRQKKNITFNMHKGKHLHRKNAVSDKKKLKHFDFPDLREAMINLFSEDFKVINEDACTLCSCQCHMSSDSSLITKSEKESNQSITSSIGNFSLDSTTLSAFSESLDHIISYNSFNDSTLFNTLLQKPAIERITFYIQVHSIQLKSDQTQSDYASRNNISFYCPTCKTTDYDEHGLLRHILGDYHCEKIHFVYKTAYVKKCISAGKEIQPSTVLNPMTMYRDKNKIVCFGDAIYACSLCFENLIKGESILMAHCAQEEHLSRRDMLEDIFD